MHRYLVLLFLLLSLAFIGPASAAGPDDAAFTPGVMLDGPALVQDEAFSHSGAAIRVQPASVGLRHPGYRTWAAARPTEADSRCCAEYFGGFGPLWETYCADRNQPCGAAAACVPARCGPPQRCSLLPLRWGACRQPVRVRLHGSSCGCCSGSACDYVPAAAMTEQADAERTPPDPAEVPQADEETPAPVQPDPALEPAPPAPPPEPPAAEEAKNASSRRGWLQRWTAPMFPR